MRVASEHTPDDPVILRRLLDEQRALTEKANHERDVLREQLESRDAEALHLRTWIEKLKLQIAHLKRLKFGQSSEKYDAQIDQLELILEDLEATQAQRAKPAAAKTEPRQSAKRKPFPEHLEREVHVHRPDTDCPCCGKPMHQIGCDASEMIEYVPAHFKVIRHERPRFACKGCQKVIQAPAPSRPIERGLAGPALLAHILVSKYCDHAPLYRQSGIYARQGVELDRSFLADCVGQCHRLIDPLSAALERYVLASPVKLHADDTPVPVLQPGRGKTKQGRFWVYVRDDSGFGSTDPPAVLFHYSPSRKGEYPQGHLASYKERALQADAYAGYNAIYEKNRVTEVACWMHARRKFFELHKSTKSPACAHALTEIAKLYVIEKQIKGKPPQERQRARQLQAKPILEELHQWMIDTLAQTGKKSALAGAIKYSLTLWRALTRYLDDGRLEIDSGPAERALRGVALGRKNYLFAGSDAGGERAAAIYSLIETVKLLGVNPEAYLRQVLTQIADHPVNKIDDLLPWNIDRATDNTSSTD